MRKDTPKHQLTMERLKPRNEVLSPDVRNRNRANFDHSTGVISEMTFDSVYDEVEKIRINDTAPESVRSHFEIARNLVLYSWFVYSFNVVAAMQAFASLEMALKAKTGEPKGGLKRQLEKVFSGRKLSSGVGPPVDLSVALSNLRNDLADGSPTIHGQGLMIISACADLINEIYG